MFRPLPPSQRRCSPTLIHRSASSPSTCRRSISQRVEPRARLLLARRHLAPARDRVLLVEEARVHDLLPVLLLRHARLRRHRRGAVEAERPREAPRVLLLAAPVEQRAQRLAPAHDLRRVDGVQGVRIGRGDHRDLVIDLVDQPAHVLRGKAFELLIARQLVEVAREVEAVIVIGLIRADHMAARSPHGLLQLHVQGLGALGRHHAHDLARLARPRRRRGRSRRARRHNARGSPGEGCRSSLDLSGAGHSHRPARSGAEFADGVAS